MIVYKATNLINNKIYIGITTLSLQDRIYRHNIDAKRKDRTTVYFHNAILKYNIKNFKFEIIDNADSIEELNLKEQHWITFYQSTDRSKGYNLDSGGKCCKKSNSTKIKIGLKKKQNWQNEELSAKMRSGLQKATLKWKLKNKNNEKVAMICPVCGKIYYLSNWESKKRKYCSLKCSSKNNNFYEYSASNKIGRNSEQHEKIKAFVEEWAIENKEIIQQSVYNKISTQLQDLLILIELQFNVKDLRTITYACYKTRSRKEFLKQLKLFCENIC